MSKCLTPAEFEAYIGGILTDTQQFTAREHLQHCEACRRTLGDEELFADIRQAFAGPDFGSVHPRGAAQPETFATLENVAEGYQVLGEIHRGGQGVVYRAVQLATKRTVALKVLLHGIVSSPRQRQRFEREIDIVASLQHPNIVTIYDSGSHEGRPYFAMEYVDGVPVDLFTGNRPIARGERRSSDVMSAVGDTLRLFQKICGAVRFAHARGVIHRDLKPGNILVDALGEPHILDFGLAKLSEPDSTTPEPRHTLSGEFLGTLAYASPEQAQGDPRLIDVRSDVYSLGVILYELLTGELPYDVTGSVSQTLKNICETEPLRPSRVRRGVDNEVETIVLKALAKDPERRYQSAEHLHRDVAHYLADEPIDAKRDSTWYVLRKTLRRYRVAVGTVAAFSLVIAASLVVSLVSLRRAVIDRDAATRAGHAAALARADEAQQRVNAEAQRAEAEFQACVANLAAARAAVRGLDVVDAWRRLSLIPERLRGWEWYHLLGMLDGSQRILPGHTSYVEQVVFSPGGKQVASAGWDQTVRIWDVASGKPWDVIQGPASALCLAYHPDGKQLAIGYVDGTVRLWDAGRHAFVGEFHGPSDAIGAVAFSRDGKRLAASFRNGEQPQPSGMVVVWDLATGRAVLEIPQAFPPGRFAFDPHSGNLVTLGDRALVYWDGSGNEVRRLTGSERYTCLALSDDGSWAAATSHDTQIHIWNVAEGQIRHTLAGHTAAVYALAFADHDRKLVSASRDRTIRLWDVAHGKEDKVFLGHTWAVASVAVSPDTQLVASGSWDQSVRLWNIEPRANLLAGHADGVVSISFAPDGRNFATASLDRTVKIWDMNRRRCTATLTGHEQAVQCVAYHPDGVLLASASWDKTVKVWDVSDSSLVRTLSGHTERAHSVAFSPDGRWLLSGSADNTLRLWDTTSWEAAEVLEGHTDHVHVAAFSSDGNWIASAGHESVRLWDAVTHKHAATFNRSIMQDDYSLAFDPTCRLLAAGSGLRSISIWDVTRRERLHEMTAHTDEIHAVAFSPCGTRLISAALDNTVRLWDVASGREVASLFGYPGYAHCVIFSPDGNHIVAGLSNGGIKIWEKQSEHVAGPTPSQVTTDNKQSKP